MEEVINTIIKSNKTLFKDEPVVTKINVGFTNTLYDIDNTYIIKICTDKSNEPKFVKEINFYNANKDNSLIPKLYYSNTDKKEVPYYCEILEKVKGVSLYNIWHTLREEEREQIIKQLCDAMKSFHKNTGETYDWKEKTINLFIELYNKTKSMNLFNEEEIELLDKAYSKFNDYLESDKFVLVHNDLHFDNIIYNEGKIKLIDFERSLYAPKDFELDIIYRMIRKPWKFASEEIEPYTKLSDYKNIMKYIEKYYPELINTKYLYKRLAIYDIVYYLKHLINYPTLKELKDDILNAAKNVIE